jgi:hypothetical protein
VSGIGNKDALDISNDRSKVNTTLHNQIDLFKPLLLLDDKVPGLEVPRLEMQANRISELGGVIPYAEEQPVFVENVSIEVVEDLVLDFCGELGDVFIA